MMSRSFLNMCSTISSLKLWDNLCHLRFVLLERILWFFLYRCCQRSEDLARCVCVFMLCGRMNLYMTVYDIVSLEICPEEDISYTR
jgi:hypothetical protein